MLQYIKRKKGEKQMENEVKNHTCAFCNRFDRYYTKGVKKFNKATCGWCCNQGVIVRYTDTCAQFAWRHYSSRPRYLTRRYLSDLLDEIAAIRQVIEETDNEKTECENLRNL